MSDYAPESTLPRISRLSISERPSTSPGAVTTGTSSSGSLGPKVPPLRSSSDSGGSSMGGMRPSLRSEGSSGGRSGSRKMGDSKADMWISPRNSNEENVSFFLFDYKTKPCPMGRTCAKKITCPLYHHEGERRRFILADSVTFTEQVRDALIVGAITAVEIPGDDPSSTEEGGGGHSASDSSSMADAKGSGGDRSAKREALRSSSTVSGGISGPIKLRYSSDPCLQVKVLGKWQSSSLCRNGDSCRYAHCLVEQMYHPNIYKTTSCERIDKGIECRYGFFCTHSHCPSQLRFAETAAKSFRSGPGGMAPRGRPGMMRSYGGGIGGMPFDHRMMRGEGGMTDTGGAGGMRPPSMRPMMPPDLGGPYGRMYGGMIRGGPHGHPPPPMGPPSDPYYNAGGYAGGAPTTPSGYPGIPPPLSSSMTSGFDRGMLGFGGVPTSSATTAAGVGSSAGAAGGGGGGTAGSSARAAAMNESEAMQALFRQQQMEQQFQDTIDGGLAGSSAGAGLTAASVAGVSSLASSAVGGGAVAPGPGSTIPGPWPMTHPLSSLTSPPFLSSTPRTGLGSASASALFAGSPYIPNSPSFNFSSTTMGGLLFPASSAPSLVGSPPGMIPAMDAAGAAALGLSVGLSTGISSPLGGGLPGMTTPLLTGEAGSSSTAASIQMLAVREAMVIERFRMLQEQLAQQSGGGFTAATSAGIAGGMAGVAGGTAAGLSGGVGIAGVGSGGGLTSMAGTTIPGGLTTTAIPSVGTATGQSSGTARGSDTSGASGSTSEGGSPGKRTAGVM